MGRHTKDASVLLTAAIGGGAVFPPIMFAAFKVHNAQYAFCVIVATFAGGALYPLCLNVVPALRNLSDPVRDEQTRQESEAEEKRRASMGDEKEKRWSKMRNRISWRKDNDHVPSVEHRERRSWPEGLAPRSGSMAIERVRTRTPSSSSSSSGR